MTAAAAPGTIAGLHRAVKNRLIEVVEYLELETKSSISRPPQVLDGWLPPKQGSEAEDYPFLILRPRTGTDTEQAADQNATADLEILAGTYSDTDDGWLDVVILIDAIRLNLNAFPTIAGTGFEQTGPLTWEIPREQTRPQWIGTVTTKWTIPRARRVDAQEG